MCSSDLADKQANLKGLAEQLGDKLSFASPERLMEKLCLEPGSVSPFGLVNNAEHDVILCIDAQVFEAPLVGFHPNDNTATLVLDQKSFARFCDAVENEVVKLES